MLTSVSHYHDDLTNGVFIFFWKNTTLIKVFDLRKKRIRWWKGKKEIEREKLNAERVFKRRLKLEKIKKKQTATWKYQEEEEEWLSLGLILFLTKEK